ncbi:MAG: 8-amino-7-oxononanoate synthase [bacterium]|nr:8-amino-7-oxononanoate synthase [bacterium]
MKEDIHTDAAAFAEEAAGGESAKERWLSGLRAEVAGLRERDLYRELRPHVGRLDFSSNDYLSLNSSGRLREFLREVLASDDRTALVGSTGSRLIRGHHDAFARAEAKFARYVGAPAALLFHSGYGANTGVLPAVIAPRDLVFCDRLCHASLLDGIRLSGARRYYFRHNDLEDLERQLRKYANGDAGASAGDGESAVAGDRKNKASRRRVWIITEAVFSMDGDSPDLRALCDLAERAEFGACVYLDEAHSIGMTGENGAGLAAEQGVANRIAVNVFPCGKAPGLMGAFVCGAPELKELLVNRARSFIFSTAQPPHLADLLSCVIDWLQTDEARAARERSRRLADELRNKLKALGFDTGTSTTHIVPIITGGEAQALSLAARCREAGLDVRAIRPPTVPKGASRLRVILQADHKSVDLDELVAVISRDA